MSCHHYTAESHLVLRVSVGEVIAGAKSSYYTFYCCCLDFDIPYRPRGLCVCWFQDVLYNLSIVLLFLFDCSFVQVGLALFGRIWLNSSSTPFICSFTHIYTHNPCTCNTSHLPPLPSCSKTTQLNMLLFSLLGLVQGRIALQLLIPSFRTNLSLLS